MTATIRSSRDFGAELHQTECWREWLARCAHYDSYTELVRRSALALKMMTGEFNLQKAWKRQASVDFRDTAIVSTITLR
jgi:hypothetical protein